MQRISEMIEAPKSDTATTFDFESRMRQQADIYNRSTGNLQGYDCPKCKNRGYFASIVDGYEVMTPCECMEHRKTLRMIAKSGLKDAINKLTFNSFNAVADWQIRIKTMAIDYVNSHERKWFYIGGQVGCGKTHICTAIVNELFKQGFAGRYMLWRDEAVKLKSNVNDSAEYQKLISPLKTVDVLYIDDFFKTEKGKSPTQADVNVAFEILNYRYNSEDLITIISSERTIENLIDIDEAVGSRIYERTRNSNIIIGADRRKNYRLNGGKA